MDYITTMKYTLCYIFHFKSLLSYPQFLIWLNFLPIMSSYWPFFQYWPHFTHATPILTIQNPLWSLYLHWPRHTHIYHPAPYWPHRTIFSYNLGPVDHSIFIHSYIDHPVLVLQFAILNHIVIYMTHVPFVSLYQCIPGTGPKWVHMYTGPRASRSHHKPSIRRSLAFPNVLEQIISKIFGKAIIIK